MADNQLILALTGAMHTSALIRENNGCEDFISIEDHIVPEIEEKLGIKITLHEGDWPLRHIKGGLKQFEDRATIYYPTSYNRCNKRFVLAKELAYLLHDWGGDSITRNEEDAESLVDYITNPEFAQARLDDKMADTVGAEEFAELYALEILLPHSHRAVIDDRGMQLDEIATTYRVPRSKVELYLNEVYEQICEAAASVIANCSPK